MSLETGVNKTIREIERKSRENISERGREINTDYVTTEKIFKKKAFGIKVDVIFSRLFYLSI